MTSTTWVTVGRLGRSHGVKGWVFVDPWTDRPEALFEWSVWYVQPHSSSSEPAPLMLEAYRPTGGQRWLVRCEGWSQPEDSLPYRNQPIMVRRSDLPPPEQGGWYWCDLVGLNVTNQVGDTLGCIDHLFRNGPQDVAVLRGVDGAKHLLPWVEGVVQSVDVDAGTCTVDWLLSDG